MPDMRSLLFPHKRGGCKGQVFPLEGDSWPPGVDKLEPDPRGSGFLSPPSSEKFRGVGCRGPSLDETSMGDEDKLRRSLFAHIEHKADELWKSIDDLQNAMEAFSPERSGDRKLSERFIELMKRLGDVGRQFRLGLAAIDESRVSTKH
jgi:hypothetical protein